MFPVNSSEYSTDNSVAAIDIFLKSSYKIVGKGFYQFLSSFAIIVYGCLFSFGNTFQNANAPAILCFAAEFCGAQYACILRMLYLFSAAQACITMRRAADAA